MNLLALIFLAASILPLDCKITLEPRNELPRPCLSLKAVYGSRIVIGKAVSAPFIVYEDRGVAYEVAYDEMDRRIRYIRTTDTSFQSSDGFSIGDEMELDVRKIRIEMGWEVYGPLTKDGWRPVFGRNTLRKEKVHTTEIGNILEEGDPSINLPKEGKVVLRIRYFSKSI